LDDRDQVESVITIDRNGQPEAIASIATRPWAQVKI
jgi:hypothetical protein